MSTERIKKILQLKKRSGKKIGMIHGVFDIIHAGHIFHINDASKKVDFLIASVTEDRFINKAPGKPFFKFENRKEVLNNIKGIDLVIKSSSKTADTNIKLIKPDIYFKGIEYKKDDITGNIIKEKKLVEKFGGVIKYTEGKVFSSSKIINEKFNYLDSDIKKFIKKINLINFKKKIYTFKKLNKKILVIGDPIIDIYRFVDPSGKSNKASIISTLLKYSRYYGGGALLVSNFLSDFCESIDLLNLVRPNTIKKFLNKNIKLINIDTVAKPIKKIRYIDNYSGVKLFQTTNNEQTKLTDKNKKILYKKTLNLIKKYDKIFVFDFGYFSLPSEILSLINKHQSKFIINCQSNSYNFGFNLATKYNKADIIAMDETEFRLCLHDRDTPLKNLILKSKKIFRNFKNVIVTSGKNGSYLIKNNKIIFCPSIFKNLKDTTGSGDIFLSMYGIIKTAMNFDDEEILLLSHLAAGLHGKYYGNLIQYSQKKIFRVAENIFK